MSRLGLTIAQARKTKFLSQKELAARIAVSPQFVNDIERDRRTPSEFVLGKLAAELNLDKDHLCLLVGILPKDLAGPIANASPTTVSSAFRTFRKTITRR